MESYAGNDGGFGKFIKPYIKANTLILGFSGRGKNLAIRIELINYLIEEEIVNKHLNNNNWLKMHGKPMRRKGFPFYKKCKMLKGVKFIGGLPVNPQLDIQYECAKQIVEKIVK